MGFSPEAPRRVIEQMPIIRMLLAEGKTVTNLPFEGVSMRPLLRQGRDTVDLSPLPPRLKKYDLPVYRYPSGKIVMHRVVAVRPDHYVCLGDNTYRYEHITPEQMIGLVTAFRRAGRYIRVDDPGYRLYCRIWVAVFPVRRFLQRAKRWVRGWLR